MENCHFESPRDQVQAIFLEAASLPDSPERRAYVVSATGDNHQLRAEVEEMLAAQEQSENFFARAVDALGQLTLEEAATGGIGPETVELDENPEIDGGRFKLMRKLGEGGCGVVYLAEQLVPIRRRVALKIIKLGMDTKSVVARFESERQALALMDHPNIARVFEAGATGTGRPYFVMELVNGIRITEYCDRNQLDSRARLALFLQVCGAIQHAHQKGIIHRDIKPSNIIVTLHDGVAVPTVIDFGIAKAIEEKLTDQTLFTAYGHFIGTPAYMSPEQATISALDVDTRSDIYSLGVLLYELLTGRTPFDTRELMNEGLDEWRRTLQDKEPLRPSVIVNAFQETERHLVAERCRTETSRLISILKGDLDWIVMKALEKDRRRRYETASGLAKDVQRYLDNEPVLARPPSRIYLLQKLVRRNRGVFVAGSSVAAALVMGTGVSIAMFLKARESEQRQAEMRVVAEQAQANEAALRRQAEARARMSDAALMVTQGKHEEAARLLQDVYELPSQPSLDAVSAFRSTGEYLASQERWQEAARYFWALIKINKFEDWQYVTLDYQSCGVALIEAGDFRAYGSFREMAVAGFSGPENVHPASRVLKTCLFQPIDDETIRNIRPLGDSVARWIEGADRKELSPWLVIPMSLWRYRCGDDESALDYCRLKLDAPDVPPSCLATIRVIIAMACQRTGKTDEAKRQFALARDAIKAASHQNWHRAGMKKEMWYDWRAARILLREAGETLEMNRDGRE